MKEQFLRLLRFLFPAKASAGREENFAPNFALATIAPPHNETDDSSSLPGVVFLDGPFGGNRGVRVSREDKIR